MVLSSLAQQCLLSCWADTPHVGEPRGFAYRDATQVHSIIARECVGTHFDWMVLPDALIGSELSPRHDRLLIPGQVISVVCQLG